MSTTTGSNVRYGSQDPTHHCNGIVIVQTRLRYPDGSMGLEVHEARGAVDYLHLVHCFSKERRAVPVSKSVR